MLDYSDMETPPTRDAAVQTEEQRRPYREAINPVVTSYGARWRARPSHRMFAEILNFISYILEFLLQPENQQLQTRLGQWQDTLRTRFHNYRLGFAYALAIYGIRF